MIAAEDIILRVISVKRSKTHFLFVFIRDALIQILKKFPQIEN
jgi:hypothetical protein